MPTVTLTGQSAVAYAGNLRIFSSDWYAFYFENQRIVDSNATALQAITGQSSSSAYGEITESGNSLFEITGQEANISLGNSVISGTENCSVVIGGIDIVSSYEPPLATGEVPISVEISISGISATADVSPISVQVDNPEVWSSGKIQRYPANAFKNSSVKLSEIVSYIEQNDVIAFGTVQINATIALDNVVSFTQVANINADGILSISDDELILLMAA